jgi:hypothetical protein
LEIVARINGHHEDIVIDRVFFQKFACLMHQRIRTRPNAVAYVLVMMKVSRGRNGSRGEELGDQASQGIAYGNRLYHSIWLPYREDASSEY